MNAEQILLDNAKANIALTRRTELRDAALEVWAERDEIVDTYWSNRTGPIDYNSPEFDTMKMISDHVEELAKTAEYIEWLAGRLYQTGGRKAPRWLIDDIYDSADNGDNGVEPVAITPPMPYRMAEDEVLPY